MSGEPLVRECGWPKTYIRGYLVSSNGAKDVVSKWVAPNLDIAGPSAPALHNKGWGLLQYILLQENFWLGLGNITEFTAIYKILQPPPSNVTNIGVQFLWLLFQASTWNSANFGDTSRHWYCTHSELLLQLFHNIHVTVMQISTFRCDTLSVNNK